MDERVLHLEDGTTIEAKVNFATLYYMQKLGVNKLIDKVEKSKKKEYSADDNMEILAKMLYVILLSNGRKCTFEDALVLLPLDDAEFVEVMEDFEEKLENLKKKQESKANMTTFTANQI